MCGGGVAAVGGAREVAGAADHDTRERDAHTTRAAARSAAVVVQTAAVCPSQGQVGNGRVAGQMGRGPQADGGGRRRGARGPAARYSIRQGGHKHWGCRGCVTIGEWEKGFGIIGLAASVANCWTAPLGACIFISSGVASMVEGAPAAPPHRERRVSAAATYYYCATPHARVACLVVAVCRARRGGRRVGGRDRAIPACIPAPITSRGTLSTRAKTCWLVSQVGPLRNRVLGMQVQLCSSEV